MNKLHHFAVSACLFALIFVPNVTAAADAPPYALSYSGRLTEVTGAPLTGPVTLSLQFFRHDSASDLVATPPQVFSGVALLQGVFQVTLTFSDSEYQNLFNGTENVWIQVTNEGSGKVYPRQRFNAVPYAQKIPVDNATLVFGTDGKLAIGTLPVQAEASHAASADTFVNALSGDVTGPQGTTKVERLQGRAVDPTAPTPGQFLMYDATVGWKAAAIVGAAGGTVTQINVGPGLAVQGGGAVTAAGTLEVPTGGIVDSMLNGSGITTAGKVSGSAITAGTIAGSTAWNSSGQVATTGNFVAKGNGTTAGEVRLSDATNANYLALKSPNTAAGTRTFVLPDTYGASGDFLKSNGAGLWSWGSLSGSGPVTFNPGTGVIGISGAGGGSPGTMSGADKTILDGLATNALLDGDFPVAGIMTTTGGGGYNTTPDNHANWDAAYADTNAATALNTVSKVVKRDPSGNFAAGTITATFAGNLTGNVTGNAATATNALEWNGGGTNLNAVAGRSSLGAAASGANGDITSLTGLTTALTVAQGGTGAASLPANNVLLGNGTSAPASVAPGAPGNLLTSNGTTWASTAPVAVNWASPGAIGSTAANSGAFTTLMTTGNVGIGTTAPQQLLDINAPFGRMLLGGNGANISSNAYHSGGWKYSQAGYANVVSIGSSSVGDFVVYTADPGTADAAATLNDRFHILNNGNVGIGTNSPSRLLTIRGTNTSGSYPMVNFLHPNNADKGFQVGNPAWNDGLNAELWNWENGFVRIGTNSLERVRIDAAGNVGIGTTSPSRTLDVAFDHSSTTGMLTPLAITRTTSGTASNGIGGRLEFYLENGSGSIDEAATVGALLTDVTAGSVDSALVFQTRKDSGLFAERMRIDADGNVGIGTTSPDIRGSPAYRTLTILGPNTTAGSSGIIELATQSVDADGNFAGVVNFSATANSGAKRVGAIAGLVSGTTATNRGGAVALYTTPDGGTDVLERVRITNTGNVGIGTTNPAAKLAVAGMVDLIGNANDVTNQIYLSFKRLDDSRIGYLGDGSGAVDGLYLVSSIGDGLRMSSYNGGDIRLGTDAGGTTTVTHTKVTLTNNGNVGIGTTVPQSTLQVNGYVQLALTTNTVPPAADCDAAAEYGRMKVDDQNGKLYLCVQAGWRQTTLAP